MLAATVFCFIKKSQQCFQQSRQTSGINENDQIPIL